MSKWIKKGDKVVVMSGNEKGKSGAVLVRKGDRVIIQGLNFRKKHVKKKQQMQTAQILTIEAPIHISNVALCDDKGEPIFARVKVSKEGRKLVYEKEGKEQVLRMLNQQRK